MRKRTFDKKTIFSIYNSTDTLAILAKKHNISLNAIYNIRKGKYYKDYYEEYQASKPSPKKAKTISILDKRNKDPSTCYFYLFEDVKGNKKEISMSFDNYLITINLTTRKLTINYNTIIKGNSISYERFANLITKHHIIL